MLKIFTFAALCITCGKIHNLHFPGVPQTHMQFAVFCCGQPHTIDVSVDDPPSYVSNPVLGGGLRVENYGCFLNGVELTDFEVMDLAAKLNSYLAGELVK